jgi:hypothetical protein
VKLERIKVRLVKVKACAVYRLSGLAVATVKDSKRSRDLGAGRRAFI